jgi:hypothetical protein
MAWGLKSEYHRTTAIGGEGIAEMMNIHMCLTSRICEQAGSWRNRVFSGHFKIFLNCGLSASAKKLRCPRTLF